MPRIARTDAIPGLLATLSFAGLAAWRLALPERGPDVTGVHAVADGGFASLLAILIILLCLAIGKRLAEALGVWQDSHPWEALVFAFVLGGGTIAYAILALGFVGLLTPRGVISLLALGGLLAGKDILDVVRYVRQAAASTSSGGGRSFFPAIGTGVALAIFLFAAVQCLAPAWDYDGLVYHLQAPRLFLQSGRVVPLPELWQANGPLTVEMLYAAGLAFGSDSAARLLHLAMAATLVLATFAAGRRWAGPAGGWLAAGVLLGIPIFPIWGSLAFADLGWAMFEFASVVALLRFRETGRIPWLIVSGVSLGFSLGSKYLAVGMLGTLAIALAFESGRRDGLRASLRYTGILVGTSVLVALPWYLKNLSWFGNPVYPLLFGGPGWPAERVAALMSFNFSFGTGRSITDLLLIPWNLYARHEAFGSFMASLEVPSLLFPLALASPFLIRRAAIRRLEWITLMRYGFWIIGSQPFRYLLPLFPLLAVLVAAVLMEVYDRAGRHRLLRIAGTTVALGVVVTTLAYQIILFMSLRPLPSVLGSEPKEAFLGRTVGGYRALRHLLTAPDVGRVYMAWDGQGYYCDERCIVDAEQSQWAQLVHNAVSDEAITAVLREAGVTHVLVNLEGMNFLLRHDPAGIHREGADALIGGYGRSCLSPVFVSESAVAYALTCG